MHGILKMIFLHVFVVFQTPQENLHAAENNWISVATKSCVTAWNTRHSGKENNTDLVILHYFLVQPKISKLCCNCNLRLLLIKISNINMRFVPYVQYFPLCPALRFCFYVFNSAVVRSTHKVRNSHISSIVKR